jgi:molecular chaperone GrpE
VTPRADGAPDDVLPDDDEVVEAEIVDDADPESAEDASSGRAEGAPDEQTFVDGTVGRSDLAAERDEYLEALQRVKAEFDNYRKRTEKQRTEMVERATGQLVEQLLPVLDACDAAVSHGATEVEPIQNALLDILGREGLDPMPGVGEPFDPNLHEAVMHEPGDDDRPTVAEEMRRGYLWKGRVLRPAMVKVRG